MGIIQRQSIQASIITYLGALLGYVNFILLYPIYLSPQQVGLTRLIISVAVLFSQFALLGSSYTLQRFFPFFNNKQEKHFGFLTFIYLIALAGFILFSFVFYIGKPFVVEFYIQRSPLFTENYFFIYPVAFFLLVFEVLFFYARSLLKTVVPTFIKEVFLRLLQSAVLFVYVFNWVNFEGFLYCFVASYVLHYLVMLAYLARLNQLHLFTSIRIAAIIPLHKLSRYNWFVYAASIAAVYTANIDVIMLGALAGLEETAIYSVAFFIATLVIIPSRTMNQVSIPIIAEAWKNNDMNKLQELYRQTSINQLVVGGYIYLMLWLNIDWIVNLLPPVYAPVKGVFLIVGFGRLLDMATGINGEIILYSRHIKFNLLTNVLLIVVSTTTTYILIPEWGVIGAAVSIPVSYLAYNSIRMLFLSLVYKIHPFTTKTLLAVLWISIWGLIVFIIPTDYKSIWISILFSLLVSVIYIYAILQFSISAEINALWNKYKHLIRL